MERGTVQHEVLEGKKQIQAFEDGETLRIQRYLQKGRAPRASMQSFPMGSL
ncbi:hypothetical protein [Castellaniella sp.]|uniref:hypothetical protein n=1 Tax=Castellaniella sp. TaxID=1955812 RepID=UPI002AFEE941|nr:hypothetical protein [Castellaniella sp.]